MKILLPIKQVPEIRDVRMDEASGTVIREGVEAIVNPLDLYAIELGLRIKEQVGGSLKAMTMGPPNAAKALREAVAMGVDEAVLANDKAFAGSDTWATSLVLARLIANSGDFDLIICGERAIDGDTGQVGPGIASCLSLPAVTYVSGLEEIGANTITVRRMIEGGYERVSVRLPALITVVKEAAEPRLPTLAGKKRSRQIKIPAFGIDQVGINPQQVGLKGSPTKVVKITKPKVARQCELFKVSDQTALKKAAEKFCEFTSQC